MSFPSEAGRLPTLEALERELVARADTRIPPRYPRATVVAAVVAFIVALTALTPFGRAVAEQIADWIGIGDPPTREERNPVGEPAVVIGYGTANGVRYELVASTRPAFSLGTGEPTPCFDVDFPDVSSFFAHCLTPETRAAVQTRGLTVGAVSSSTGPVPGSPLMVGGIAAADASRVVLSTGRSSAPISATVGRLTPELAKKIELNEPFTFYVAFMPDGQAETVAARAYDDDGRLLGEARSPIGRPPPPG
jgi:hypothetical protein